MEIEIQHRNINLDFLKVICAFLVIVEHFGSQCPYFIKGITPLAVPIFMILSFYFLIQKISTIDIEKRVFRILIPLIGWSVIYSILYLFILKRNITVYDFLWQSITGHSPKLNASMWFSSDLIALTLLIFILYKYFKKYFFKIIFCLFCLSYLFEYSEINYMLFSDLRYELKYPLGRLTEMIPFMVVGIFLGKYDILKCCKSRFILGWLILFLFTQECIFFPSIKGFDYCGIKLILLAVLMILFFSSIPQKRIFQKFVCVLGKNTMGIYCIHRLVEAFLHPYFGGTQNLFYCLLIFIISWLICFGISKIPLKYIHYLVK